MNVNWVVFPFRGIKSTSTLSRYILQLQEIQLSLGVRVLSLKPSFYACSVNFTKTRKELTSNVWRAPKYALQFWKKKNSKVSYKRPLHFNNKISKSVLSSQASSESMGKIFSNLGRSDGPEIPAKLNSTLGMTRIICVFLKSEVEDNLTVQIGLLHPIAASFRKTVQMDALEVNRGR